MTALLLALTLGAPAEIGGKDNKAEKAELEKLQGIWKLTERETRTGTFPPAKGPGAIAERYTLVVSGDGYVLATHGGTIKFDPAKKTVDMTITDGRYKGATVQGLYELSGDTLKVAITVPSIRGGVVRPTALKPENDATHTLYTFEKDGKATKDDVATKLKDLKSGLPAGAAALQFGP